MQDQMSRTWYVSYKRHFTHHAKNYAHHAIATGRIDPIHTVSRKRVQYVAIHVLTPFTSPWIRLIVTAYPDPIWKIWNCVSNTVHLLKLRLHFRHSCESFAAKNSCSIMYCGIAYSRIYELEKKITHTIVFLCTTLCHAQTVPMFDRPIRWPNSN